MWYFPSKLASHVTHHPRLPSSSPIWTSRHHLYEYATNVHISFTRQNVPSVCWMSCLLNILGTFKVGNSVSNPGERRTSIEKPGQWPTYINLLKPTGYVIHQQVCTFCSHFVCFVFTSEQTATSAPYNINCLVFITECLLRGTNWVFKQRSLLFAFKGLKKTLLQFWIGNPASITVGNNSYYVLRQRI